jgi:hypothetical protein
MSKKPRTEKLSVTFVNRQAEGWVFGVGDAFLMQLDIRLDERVDKEANTAKEQKLGRKLEKSEKLKRLVWTEGNPPSFGFDRGHIFHETNESSTGIRRSIVVTRARPDAGALVQSIVTDENGFQTTISADSDSEDTGGGFVDYEILTYKDGVLIRDENGSAIKELSSRTQAGFVSLLRCGL